MLTHTQRHLSATNNWGQGSNGHPGQESQPVSRLIFEDRNAGLIRKRAENLEKREKLEGRAKLHQAKIAVLPADQEKILEIFSNDSARTEARKLINVILAANPDAPMPELDFSEIDFNLLCSSATIPESKFKTIAGKDVISKAQPNPSERALVTYIAKELKRKVLGIYLDKAIFPGNTNLVEVEVPEIVTSEAA